VQHTAVGPAGWVDDQHTTQLTHECCNPPQHVPQANLVDRVMERCRESLVAMPAMLCVGIYNDQPQMAQGRCLRGDLTLE
jgi:hypothetical protein